MPGGPKRAAGLFCFRRCTWARRVGRVPAGRSGCRPAGTLLSLAGFRHLRSDTGPEGCRPPGPNAMKSLPQPMTHRRLLANPFSRCTSVQLLVREPADYCPGCNTRLGCICPPPDHEDAALEASYTLGLDHGAADGFENRPTRDWCIDANLDADEYLAGYDAGCQTTVPAVVCEPAAAFAAPRAHRVGRGARVPESDKSDSEARLIRVAAEAQRWLAFAGERSRMRPETVLAKTLQSACFSAQSGASSFAVPSKLVGVRDHQRTLWALVRDGYAGYERLAVDTTEGGVLVWRGDEILGEVQSKHVPWVRPLVAFGLTVHLSRVTGHETEGHTLGVNIVFGGVGRALAALAEALGTSDGAASGDGAAGDGAPVNLRLVVPEALSEASSSEEAPEQMQDIVLWRDARGTARASLGTAEGAPLSHVVRHSPTGIEWGYGGSGPSDLALSVLTAVAGAETAERHYRALVADVITRVPRAGGLLRAERARAWLHRQETASNEPTSGRAAA